MSKIAVLGTGYVGLVTGACLSDFGHTVVCVDVDEEKIAQLQRGRLPIFEPGLEPLIERNTYYKRLSFTGDFDRAVGESEVVFIAVGTPAGADGAADLRQVEAAARGIAEFMRGYTVIVDKSTVPVGTARRVREWIEEGLSGRGVEIPFDVVSNPEFLREGSAVYEFTHPDRVVIGSDSGQALEVMRSVYRVLYLNETPFVETGPETAEMIKYASNAFLAMKITFINEVADLCEKVGADVQDVARALGRDGRISPKFLHAGPGYGGSCFPKDTLALCALGKSSGARQYLIERTIESNERQKLLMAEKITSRLGSDLRGTTLAVLGLAFKQDTDDMRESPAIPILSALRHAGSQLRVYDPAAMEQLPRWLPDASEEIYRAADEYDAMEGADALVILTPWNQFRNLDLQRVKALLRQPIVFDFRNVYNRRLMEGEGFEYCGVGV
jgi:UDPglucose 6-dehydrogenase